MLSRNLAITVFLFYYYALICLCLRTLLFPPSFREEFPIRFSVITASGYVYELDTKIKLTDYVYLLLILNIDKKLVVHDCRIIRL